jgi:hypothetical protein
MYSRKSIRKIWVDPAELPYHDTRAKAVYLGSDQRLALPHCLDGQFQLPSFGLIRCILERFLELRT